MQISLNSNVEKSKCENMKENFDNNEKDLNGSLDVQKKVFWISAEITWHQAQVGAVDYKLEKWIYFPMLEV